MIVIPETLNKLAMSGSGETSLIFLLLVNKMIFLLLNNNNPYTYTYYAFLFGFLPKVNLCLVRK
jgi:hypothetical protein